MKYGQIEGVNKKISKLVMGVDNQNDLNEASKNYGIIGLMLEEIFLIQHIHMEEEITKKFLVNG